jgi:hypothetical protein
MRIFERRVGDAVVLDLQGPLAGHKAVTILESAVRRHCQEGVRDIVALGESRNMAVGVTSRGSATVPFATLQRPLRRV